MAGNQSRGLVAASKTKGWDPTVIAGGESIAPFDVDQGNLAGTPVGRLPGGPKPAWPDGFDVNVGAPMSTPFNHPSPSKGSGRTRNANPTPGR